MDATTEALAVCTFQTQAQQPQQLQLQQDQQQTRPTDAMSAASTPIDPFSSAVGQHFIQYKSASIKVQTVEGAGIGVVAVKDIKAGTLLIKERPVSVVFNTASDADMADMSLLNQTSPGSPHDPDLDDDEALALLQSVRQVVALLQSGEAQPFLSSLISLLHPRTADDPVFTVRKDILEKATAAVLSLLQRSQQPRTSAAASSLPLAHDTMSPVSVDPMLVQRLLALVQQNSVNFSRGSTGVYTVAFAFAHFNHSCTPNCSAYTDLNDMQSQQPSVLIRAVRDIKQDEQVFLSYAELSLPKSQRKEQLSKYLFDCNCVRCLGAPQFATVDPYMYTITSTKSRALELADVLEQAQSSTDPDQACLLFKRFLSDAPSILHPMHRDLYEGTLAFVRLVARFHTKSQLCAQSIPQAAKAFTSILAFAKVVYPSNHPLLMGLYLEASRMAHLAGFADQAKEFAQQSEAARNICFGVRCALKECNKFLDLENKCSRCLQVAYCNAACQTAHWKQSHKAECVKK